MMNLEKRRGPNKNNPALKKIKMLKADVKEREKLWLDTLVITTIHYNRLATDN